MLMRTDPFRELDRLAQQLLGQNDTRLAMPMDAWREGHRFMVELDLPGVREDDIDLEVERNVLTVKAERRTVDNGTLDNGTAEPGDREIIHAERPAGTFMRQIFLSDVLDTEHVEAVYRDGVLTLTIPMAEEAKPRKVLVASGKQAIEQ
ncbi:Hsp20/alpha crystallin family protein [Glycomyces algeriensis]|jgi:HSP20 family protein|uniref:18 kDa antigen n=1 Tax=Glycomyces algeriensis TaxID=256037 RepID=A0A9W6LFI7_9ACTN|nr:Hsp20/alpha crystallin family protein [Glycomyces algeriensis]MDA1367635.1 Hsp20/alpha crystallin family protein [Glycomyces algeriensis]MDR7352975.1 HSP20 family protein [Glycomyces algeriensis]GLI40664.1 18 kDa antigen [Glycomyces algeriensis]